MILDWEMRKFRYSNPFQILPFILLILIFSTPFILYTFGIYDASQSDENEEGLAVVCFITVLVIFCILFILVFSPIFTYHELKCDRLILRIGILFYGEIPLENIKNIDNSPKMLHHFGIHVDTKKQELYITTTRKNQLVIELYKSQKFGRFARNKYVKSIFLTVDYPDEMIIAVKNNMNRLGLEII